jgi:hypothetical protein
MPKPNSIAVLKLLILLIGSVGAASWLCQKKNVERHERIAMNQSIKIEDLPGRRTSIDEMKPEWIFIGNSMLRTRILIDDQPDGSDNGIDDRCGQECEWIRRGGSQSAIWYFYVKNIIAKAKHTPQWVTIFFRDTDLSWPDYRTSGLFEEYLFSLHEGPEPEFEQVMNGIHEGESWILGQAQIQMKKNFPTNVINRQARQKVQDFAFQTFGLGDMTNGQRRDEMNTLFSLEGLRIDLATASKGLQLGQPEDGAPGEASNSAPAGDDQAADPGMYDMGPKDFSPHPSLSFIPHMVEIAQKKGFKLHFHRIKRRPPVIKTLSPAQTTERQDTDTMIRYMAALGKYCTENGVLLTDETADPAYTLEMYQDGDHIAEKYRAFYTEHFWQTMKDKIIFRSPATP